MANTVTSKGQVTIPKKVRERLGIHAGSTVAFELTDSGEVVLRPVAHGGGAERLRCRRAGSQNCGAGPL